MTLPEIQALITFLRAQGVHRFEGNGVKVELGYAPSEVPQPAARAPEPPRMVEAEGMMVPADLLAHEGAS